MPRGFSGNLIFAIVARMLCGNHLNTLPEARFNLFSRANQGDTYRFELKERFIKVRNLL